MIHNHSFSRCVLAVLLCLCVYLGAVALGQDARAFSLVLYGEASPVTPTAPTTPSNSTESTERTQPAEPAPTVPEAVVSFSPQELVDIKYLCSADADPEELLCGSLNWDLTVPEPTVRIVHTQTTEAYCDTYDRANFRTRDETGNMLAIGDEVARVLALGGVTAIHDRTIHDDPDYNGAYPAARKTIEGWLDRYPSIQIVLDLHRDSIEDSNGNVLGEFNNKKREAVSEYTAYLMANLMQGVVNGGTGYALRGRFGFTGEIAGKTGTTIRTSDAWFMGITPELVSGCWVGGEDRDIHFGSMVYGQGAAMALPVWAYYMKKVYSDKTLGYSTSAVFDLPASFNPCGKMLNEIMIDESDEEAILLEENIEE